MLGFRQAATEPRAPLEGVEGVEGVGADFAGLDVPEDRPDDPPDVALVSDPGGRGELGHLELDPVRHALWSAGTSLLYTGAVFTLVTVVQSMYRERSESSIWNRLSSGTYFPRPVRGVEIP